MRAEFHPSESARLQSLRSYEVLDTDREAPFDDLVKLAAAICQTPIAVVTLVDADRQWFKAEVGMGMQQMPRDNSLCAHAILKPGLTEIPDALLDERMKDNPLVHDEGGLRFYAGVPLVSDAGLPIGTLCVLDHVPRELTPLQRDTLRVLADQVMTQLELRKALRTATMLRQEVDHRVKNSLQSLSSLARIESRNLQSPEAVTVMQKMTARLDAVSTLHELLYQTDAGSRIDLSGYVRRICDHTGRIAPVGVSVTVKADPVLVSSGQAVSVGTLINELIANSFKHAFPGGRRGLIKVTVAHETSDDAQPGGAAEVVVTCCDNGVGDVRSVAPRPGGLGMKIAAVACMELDCTLQVTAADPGICVSFAFNPDQVVQATSMCQVHSALG